MSTPEEYTFSEGGLSASAQTRHESSATPEQLLTLAKTIWKKVKAAGGEAGESAANEALLDKLQTEHKDFSISFPIVLRWMVQMRQYSAKAFAQYLGDYIKTDRESRDAYRDLIARYPVYLRRALDPHVTETALQQLHDALVAQLVKEDEAFSKAQEAVLDEMQKEESLQNDALRALLYAQLARRAPATLAAAGPPVGPEAGGPMLEC